MLSMTKLKRCPFLLLVTLSVTLALNLYYAIQSRNAITSQVRDITDFSGSNYNETGYPFYVVPNIVHLAHFVDGHQTKSNSFELSFIEVVTIKAAYRNQNPDKIYLHCNCKGFRGKYWNMLKDIPVLELKYMERPTHIFGKQFNSVHHASDIARILVLQKYGGIYIDTDSYIVQSLDKYRKFEFTLGWPIGAYLGTQILVANRNARFLRMWYDSYRDYQPAKWYYNAGELPTKSILDVVPELVHRVPLRFGVHDLKGMLYRNDTAEWETYDAIHLLYRHLSPLDKKLLKGEFNEETVKTYNATFGRMARLVLYGTKNMIYQQTSSAT